MTKIDLCEVGKKSLIHVLLPVAVLVGLQNLIGSAQAATITVGETNVLAGADGGNGNLLVAQQATLSQAATIQSLSFYVSTAAGNLRLAVYDASGPGGGPGAKKAETNSFAAVTGWNTANVTSPAALAAGNYWLAYLPSSNTLGFKVQSGSGSSKYYSFTFGTMPATFSTSPSSCSCHWSFYATLASASSDVTAPSMPGGLSATAVSTSQINLAWTASTDDTGVSGYKVFRNSLQINTSTAPSYADTGLQASTAYTYYVSAYDAAGNNSAPSTSVSATTMAIAADTTPPTVSLSAPVNNSVVAGTVTITASASDNVRVAGVQFLLDGANLGAEDTSSPYSLSWNTTTASGGTHTLSARARDAAGNTGLSTSVTVTVDNQAPTGTVTIDGGTSVTNTTSAVLTLSATDALTSVTQMRFSNTGSSFSTAQAYATTANWTLATKDGAKTVYAQFKDVAGNWSASVSSTITLDTTAPTISAVASTGLTNNSATITWTTNEPATSQVDYGTTTSYGTSTSVNPTLTTSHSVGVSGLTATTKYDYRVRSTDAAGNTKVGSNSTFTTLAAPPDTTPPSLPANLTASAASDTRIGLTWSAATDNVAVAGYRVLRNNVRIATTSAPSYVDSGLAPNTTYSYAVSAYDAAGNDSGPTSSVSAMTLPDTTPPTVSIAFPLNNATIARKIAISATASDDVAIAGVTFQIDGTNLGPEVVVPPYAITVDTTTIADGSHTLTAIARDTSNLTTTSAPVSVVVNNANPPPASTPTLVQHVSTASNPDPDDGKAGNPYFISLPNTSGAGNALILGISYPFAATRTVAISDDKSNVWTLGTTTPSNPAVGQMVSSLYYALNVSAGTQKITVTFDTGVFNFQAVVSEFYNVAGAAAIDGSAGTASSPAPAVASGAFTTVSTGDLIYSYAFDINNTNSITGLASGPGFTLLSADVQLGSVAQYSVQASAGSINPMVTVTGGSDSFNAVGLALVSAVAGTAPPPGIHIAHVYHVLYSGRTPLQFPADGNLLVCLTAFAITQVNVSNISTTPANTWVKASVGEPTDFPQIWYSPNATTGPNMQLTPTRASTSSGVTLVCYDVENADPAPYDATAGLPEVGVLNTNNANLLNMPTITPTTPNGLVFAVMSNGIGPTTGMVDPGFTLDTITYGNQIDADEFDNADGYAHYYNSTATPVSFGWTMNSSMLPDWSAAVAIAFKGAATP